MPVCSNGNLKTNREEKYQIMDLDSKMQMVRCITIINCCYNYGRTLLRRILATKIK